MKHFIIMQSHFSPLLLHALLLSWQPQGAYGFVRPLGATTLNTARRRMPLLSNESLLFMNGRTILRPLPMMVPAAADAVVASQTLESVDTYTVAAATAAIVSSPIAGITKGAQLGGFPAAGMLLATGIGLKVQTPPTVVGSLQHFAAGILLATVAKELLPEMVNAAGWAENLASGVGFFAGVGVLILLGYLFPEEDDDGDLLAQQVIPVVQEEGTTAATSSSPSPSLRNRRLSFKGEAFALCQGEMATSWETTAGTLSMNNEMEVGDGREVAETTTTQTELERLDAAGLTSQTGETTIVSPSTAGDDNGTSAIAATSLALLPTALLTAIAIDALLDGLLIGISTAVGQATTGPMLSASLTVESSFLGLTLATALQSGAARSRGPTSLLVVAALLGPVSLLTGSITGGGLAHTLQDSPVLLAGLLGFGTSALLFMVAEELLLQAHEDGGDHVWYVDLQLYTGFFASVMVDKFCNANMMVL